MLLHEQDIRARWMHRDPMNTVSNLCVRVRQLVRRFQTGISRLPGFAFVIRAESASRRDRNENSIGSIGIKNDRVQTHPSRPGLPKVALGAAQSGKLLPGVAAIHSLEQCRVFNAGVNGVRISQRRFEMPDPLEFPRMLRPVVPLVSAGNAVIIEFVTGGFPGFSAVIRALDDLAKPAAGLRRIQTIRFNRRAFDVINLPTRKVRSVNFPPVALPISSQNECTFSGANQYSYFAHIVVRSNDTTNERPKSGLLF